MKTRRDFDPTITFEGIRKSPDKKRPMLNKRNQAAIVTARRLATAESGKFVKDEVRFITSNLVLQKPNQLFENLGVSLFSNAFARKIFYNCYDKSLSEAKKFARRMENFVTSEEDRRSSSFVQLGGAVILRTGVKPELPRFVAFEVVEGRPQLREETIEATRLLASSGSHLVQQAARTMVHMSAVKVFGEPDAQEVQAAFNDSEIPGTWIDLSELRTEPCPLN